MSAALRTTHYCLLPTGHTISDNNERASVFRRSRLTAFKARRAALKSTTDDTCCRGVRTPSPQLFNAYRFHIDYKMTDC
jgi:hypothetical protein